MIIIPARMESSRFPNKIIEDINGYPMVIATARRVQDIDKVLIATDSKRVVDLAKDYGFNAIMTSKNHQSGTDRINEAANKIEVHETEVIVNVQADEPFIEPCVVKSVIDLVKNKDCFMASCYKIIDKTFANNPNHVKVITDIDNYAIYFSRSKIPYARDEHLDYFLHLGIYGFTLKNLREFCQLPLAPLEKIEKLEQLRAIYHGKKIAMTKVESSSFGIDTKEDLEKALKYCE